MGTQHIYLRPEFSPAREGVDALGPAETEDAAAGPWGGAGVSPGEATTAVTLRTGPDGCDSGPACGHTHVGCRERSQRQTRTSAGSRRVGEFGGSSDCRRGAGRREHTAGPPVTRATVLWKEGGCAPGPRSRGRRGMRGGGGRAARISGQGRRAGGRTTGRRAPSPAAPSAPSFTGDLITGLLKRTRRTFKRFYFSQRNLITLGPLGGICLTLRAPVPSHDGSPR